MNSKSFAHVTHTFPELVQETTDKYRVYVTPDGMKYPSVTTVLSDYSKEGIDAWKKRVGEEEAERVSKTATKRGTEVHRAIEAYLSNIPIYDTDINTMPQVKSLFVKMRKELNKLDNIHCLETRMFSHKLRIAGTVDCIAEYDGVLSVVDFKTSSRMKKKEHIKNYFMQGTAYAIMFEELTGIQAEQVVIIIGVDNSHCCQIMKVHPFDFRDDLLAYINNYYSKQEQLV